MARKSGTLHRIASKTVAAGREHVAKLLKGEETIPEAAGAAVEELLSSPRAKAASQKAAKVLSKAKVATKKKPTAKAGSPRKKSKTG